MEESKWKKCAHLYMLDFALLMILEVALRFLYKQ
jgi:hypothetical protein